MQKPILARRSMLVMIAVALTWLTVHRAAAATGNADKRAADKTIGSKNTHAKNVKTAKRSNAGPNTSKVARRIRSRNDAPPPAPAGIKKHEIALTGTVSSIDSTGNTLSILVSSFALPNGHARNLTVLKTRSLSFGHPEIVDSSDPDRKMQIDDIRPRTRITVIGRDKPGAVSFKVRKILIQ